MADFHADTASAGRVARELSAAGHQLTELEAANVRVGRVVIAAARPPRRSGQLAAGSHADATRNGVTWASAARYWTFIHWGAPRRHIHARPYFVEAVRHNTDDIVAVYAAHVTDTLRRIT